jgi:hypothetical protein
VTFYKVGDGFGDELVTALETCKSWKSGHGIETKTALA